MPTQQVEPKFYSIGNAFLGGIDRAHEGQRRNALLNLDQRRNALYERQVHSQERRLDQADTERRAGAEAAKRKQARGTAFAVAARTGRFDQAMPFLADLDLDPRQFASDDPADMQEMFALLAKNEGMDAGEQSPGALYQIDDEQGPQFATAAQAVGKRPYSKPSSEARGTWGQPFEAIDPMTGKPGMFQNHSITGQIRPATVGAKAIGPKPQGSGSESTAADSLIWRQAVAYFGGIIDPQTGNITGLDPTQSARIQELAANASRVHRDSAGSVTPAEAVQRAISGGSRQPVSGQGGNRSASGPLPESARARLKEGMVTTFANGQRWTLQNGQPAQVQ